MIDHHSAEENTSASRPTLRLLLVEDNPGDADLIMEMLEEHKPNGYGIETVPRLERALERMNQEEFDLALLDLNLPDSYGLETIRTVIATKPDLAVVVISGLDDEQTAQAALREGAQDYIVKGKVTAHIIGRILQHALERHENHRKLAASEQFMRASLDALSANIAIIDQSGRILAVNEAWRRFARDNDMDPDAVSIGSNYLAVCDGALGEETPSAFAAGIRNVLDATDSVFEIEYPCHSPNENRWFNGRVTAFGMPPARCAVIAHENITQRKKAEMETQAAARRLGQVIDSSLNSMAVKDARGRFLLVNDSMAKMHNTSKTTMIGRTINELADLGLINHEDALEFSMDDQKVLDQSRTIVIEQESITWPDGTVRWFKTVKAPISFTDNPHCLLIIATDITDQQRATEALRNSELRQRTMLDAQPNSVILLDVEKTIVWPNEAACTAAGLPRDALIGQRCYQMMRNRDSGCPDCPVEAALKQETLLTEIRRADDRTWRITACPVRDETGAVVQAVEVAEDITEQSALQEHLYRAQRLESIGTLAGGIAHDFNNILSAIVGFTEMALEKSQFNPSIHEDLEEVLHAGQRAGSLVAQILAFSRQSEADKGPVQIHLIVKEALKLLRATMPTTIEIRQKLLSFATVLADPNQMHQVIMNLCTNAYHAMQENGGVMTVALTEATIPTDLSVEIPDLPQGKYLCLRVTDTGTGMDETIMKRIFDPYFTTKEKGRGTGLGLAVTYGIVQSHDGHIDVESTPGRGTTFRVLLPILAQDGTMANKAEEKHVAPTGRERILFVDDETALTHIAFRMLSSLGYQVTVSSDGNEALDLFRNRPDQFDLVITDMTMPRMTGDRLTREILKIKPDMPVIVCTGFSERISEEKVIKLGGRALVMKPWLKQTFAETIRKVLGNDENESG